MKAVPSNANMAMPATVTNKATTSVGVLSSVAAMVCISAGRAALVRVYQRTVSGPAEANLWFRRYYIGSTLSALGWAAGVCVFMIGVSSEARFFTAGMVGATIAGAVPMLAPSRLALRTYVLVSVLPISLIAFFDHREPADTVLAVAALLFMGDMINKSNTSKTIRGVGSLIGFGTSPAATGSDQ